jgi:hypothetical protein
LFAGQHEFSIVSVCRVELALGFAGVFSEGSAQAIAPLAFSLPMDRLGGRVLVISSALSLLALTALGLWYTASHISDQPTMRNADFYDF